MDSRLCLVIPVFTHYTCIEVDWNLFKQNLKRFKFSKISRSRYHAKADPNNITLLLSESTKEDANKLVAGVLPRRMQTQDRGQHYNLETDVTIIIGRLSVCGVVYPCMWTWSTTLAGPLAAGRRLVCGCDLWGEPMTQAGSWLQRHGRLRLHSVRGILKKQYFSCRLDMLLFFFV